MTLESLTVDTLWVGFLLFCRIGFVWMLMPGLGENYVPMRVRLLCAVSFTVLLLPILQPRVPAYNAELIVQAMSITAELVTGFFLGLAARMVLHTVHMAGMIIAMQSGLGSATLFDPNSGTTGAVVGNFMTLIVTVLFFLLNLHHIALNTLAHSYDVFPVGKFLPSEDVLHAATAWVSRGMALAFKLAAPYIVLGLVLQIVAGVLARLMPALQIFVLMQPAQILVTFFLMMVTLTAALSWYMHVAAETVQQLEMPAP